MSCLFSDRTVIVVFDGVVRSTWEVFCYFCPSIPVDFLQIEDYFIFFFRPTRLIDVRVKVVMPSFSTLLTSTSSQMVLILELFGDKCPLLYS